MPTFALILLLTCGLWLPAQAQQVHLDTTSTPSRPVYRVVDEHSYFPGGMSQLIIYLRKNLRYPEAAQKAGIEGRVFVSFIVSEQGAIQNVSVLKGLGPQLDAEAVRLIKAMPNWIPAKQGGQVVACRFNLPVNFSLNALP